MLFSERVRVNMSLNKNLCIRQVKSLDYLNRCIILYVYVDIAVLI